MKKYILNVILFLLVIPVNSFAANIRNCGKDDWERLFNNDFSYIEKYKKDPCLFVSPYIDKNSIEYNFQIVRRFDEEGSFYVRMFLESSNGEVLTPKALNNLVFVKSSDNRLINQKNNLLAYYLPLSNHKLLIVGIGELDRMQQISNDAYQDKIFIMVDIKEP